MEISWRSVWDVYLENEDNIISIGINTVSTVVLLVNAIS